LLASFKYLKELYYAVGILLGVFVVGIFGFMVIEEYSFSEAFYMTVITVSTVGFKEVRSLSAEGRIFTIVLILVSFGTFAFALSSISKYIITGTFRRYYKKFKMDSRIKKLSGHVVLCGVGRNGMEALHNLHQYDCKVVVIENDEKIAESLQEKGMYYIEGDATEEESLRSAGIENASALITALPKDSDNVFVVLTAREINPKIKIVSRCAQDSSESKLKIAGADVIVMPDKVGGERMAGFITNHDVNRFIDSVSFKDEGKIYLAEFTIDQLSKTVESKSVGTVLNNLNTSCKIVGVMTKDFDYVMNPENDYTLEEAEKLFFFGQHEQIAELTERVGD
jgi:voltage-gated potassium channel